MSTRCRSRPLKHDYCFACGACPHRISLGDSMAVAVKKTLDSAFEKTVEQSIVPSTEVMVKLGVRGVILVKMASFSPIVSCQTKSFWYWPCNTRTTIVFDVNIRGRNETLLATSVSGSGKVKGGAGGFCGGVTRVARKSINDATKSALGTMAATIANAPELRPNE